jgi:glycosyltransferase involved in cell wall biosynthesis
MVKEGAVLAEFLPPVARGAVRDNGACDSPDFSVIIPTFRRQEQLLEAITSVLRQTGVTFEILVVDDCPEGSAEGTVSSIADARVSYLRNPKPTGGRPSIVRNLAWPHATGAFVHFLDDDDRVPEGHYAAVKESFARTPNVGVVFGKIEPFGTDEGQLVHERAFFARAGRRAARYQRLGSKWTFVAQMFFCETLLVCSAGVVRRDCLVAVEGFDPMLPLMEDVDFYARTIRRFGAYFMNRVSLHYRIGPSLMHRPDLQHIVKDSYRRMHAKHLAERGFVELNALRILARFLRWV